MCSNSGKFVTIKQGVSFIAANKVYTSTDKKNHNRLKREGLKKKKKNPGCLRLMFTSVGAWALGCFHRPNLSKGADNASAQLRGDKECPFSGVTSSGRVWRKVPESDARSVLHHSVEIKSAPSVA